MKKFILGGASLVAALACAVSAQATTIFSTFGPGESYLDAEAYMVASSDGFFGLQTPAFAFVSGGDYDVSQIDLALANYEGGNSAVVSLWTDVAGAPGVALGSWTVSDQAGPPPPDGPVTSITGITGVHLDAGASYFLQVAAGQADTLDGWFFNNDVDYDLESAQNGAAHTPSIAPAFAVFGGAGAAASAAPEPGTWAMLILGCGGIGASLRCRRRGGALQV